MNSISRLIANQDSDYILLPRPSRQAVVYSVLLYMFRVIDSPTMGKTLKENLGWSGQDCIDFRSRLKTSGRIQRDLKLYAYARILSADKPEKGLDIEDSDKKLITAVLRSSSPLAKKLIQRCKSYNRRGHTPKSPHTFTQTLNTVIRELDVYCKKFVSKKFLFLTQSGQLGVEDIRQGLLEFGIYAIYKAYPVINTTLHMLNIAKTAIHNRGMNVIKEQTTSSRSRMSKQKDGTFAGTLVSLGQLLVSDRIPDMGFGPTLVANSLVTGLDGRTVEGEQFKDVNRLRDLEQTVDHLYRKFKCKKKRSFLTLLMGVYDEPFSEWLGQPNDVYCSKVDRKVYANQVREYLEIPIPEARSLVVTLRTHLADFRN